MCEEVRFAAASDEEELAELFGGYGMALAGDVCEHVLIKIDNELAAAAYVTSTGDNSFHLAVFAINAANQSQGLGSRLLQEIIRNPQNYCCNLSGSDSSVSSIDGAFRVTTAAKGSSAGFYEKNGFVVCDFEELAYPYNVQCELCPDKQDCSPVPMVYLGDG